MPHGPADHDHGPIPPGEDADLPRDPAVDGGSAAAQDDGADGDPAGGDSERVAADPEGAGPDPDPDADADTGATGPTDRADDSGAAAPTDGVDDATWASIVAELAATPATADPADQPPAAAAAASDRSDVPVAPPRRTIPGRRVIRPAASEEQLQQADDWAAAIAASHAGLGRDWNGTDQIDAAAALVDEQDRFVPDDPGPVLTGSPLLIAGWTALILGIATALVVGIVWRSAPDVLWQSGLLSAALGIAVLIWQMPRDRDDEDNNDGAVV